MAEFMDVLQVKREYEEDLMAKPNVIGVGTGLKVSEGRETGEVSVVALVTHKQPDSELSNGERVPPMINGVPTDVYETGEVYAMLDRSARWRPAAPGVSLAHHRITAGTFGCVVRDRAQGTRVILSNNHVLANENAAGVGDPILQPGAASGGDVGEDTLAILARFCPLHWVGDAPPGVKQSAWVRFQVGLARLLRINRWLEKLEPPLPPQYNVVDAAVARPLQDDFILEEILEVGALNGVAVAGLGMEVRKSGRTTGLTLGRITVVDLTVVVNYSLGRTARFEHQIVTTPMSQSGDSGSLLVTGNPARAVGLLFAGSDSVTLYNPIQSVLDCLEVNL